MSDLQFVGFKGTQRVAHGTLSAVVRALQPAVGDGPRIALFDERTGRPVDVDFRGDLDAVLARLPQPVPRRGRPRLGVISREVSLLPRHWAWLKAQPSSASATLRRLIDEARKADPAAEARQAAIHRAYTFASDLAADLPDFEAASRALFADDADGLAVHTAAWPADVRSQLYRLLEQAAPA